MSSSGHVSLAWFAGFDVDDAVEEVRLAMLAAEVLLLTLSLIIFFNFLVLTFKERDNSKNNNKNKLISKDKFKEIKTLIKV
ncbi:hypothetical protein MY4824_005870 [Beauveria thailandica]